jgi:hypothetical protein
VVEDVAGSLVRPAFPRVRVSGRALMRHVCAGQEACGGAWVAVNRPWKALAWGQWAGNRRVMRRDRREMRAGRLIRSRRMVLVRALAWKRLARAPAARVRLWAIAAQASQAAFAGNDPEAGGPARCL